MSGAKTIKKAEKTIVEIGVLAYPEVLQSAVYGLTEMFYVANKLAEKHKLEKMFRISHWQQSVLTGEIACTFDSHSDLKGNDPAFLVVPPTFGDPVTGEKAAPFAQWLKRKHEAGAILTSVCAGSFFLGEAGVLGTREATTHWSFADRMASRFPDAKINADKLVIDDGDIITAGGFMAWTDLGLRIIDRVLGPTIMLECARFMLVDPPGREQRYYSAFSPELHHGDTAILKVQHWLQTTGAKDASLLGMAKKAGLEERTFLRRFRKATGLKPTEYAQQVKVGKAREMLEFSDSNIEHIAYSVGYEDVGAFRKVFHKVMGLTPGDYRHRFGQTRAA